jgi:hypothetical protein
MTARNELQSHGVGFGRVGAIRINYEGDRINCSDTPMLLPRSDVGTINTISFVESLRLKTKKHQNSRPRAHAGGSAHRILHIVSRGDVNIIYLFKLLCRRDESRAKFCKYL